MFRIQFISNTTFVTLVQLKYLNLIGNSLRHVVETRLYFEFNLKLVNLTLDTNTISSVTPHNLASLGTRRRKLTSGILASHDLKKIDINMSTEQYVEHIRKLLINAKYNEKLTDCIICMFIFDFSACQIIFVIFYYLFF